MNTTTETLEPFEGHDFELTVEYTPFFSELQLGSEMPRGMSGRLQEDYLSNEDVEYLEWCLSNFSNITEDDIKRLSTTQTFYLINVVLDTITGIETEPFEEFEENVQETEYEKDLFMETGSLGVNR